MENIKELEARRIVRNGLDKWIGTFADFNRLRLAMQREAKGVSSIEKREAFVASYLRKHKPDVCAKRVKFGLSNSYVIEVQSHPAANETIPMSKAQRQKSAAHHQALAQYAYKLDNKKTFVFIVKDGTKPTTNELILMIFEPKCENKSQLFEGHAVAVVKKHCLERVVERLDLKNLNEAIEEILPATKWLEGSGKELAGRAVGSYGDGIKRNVPTPNGALLLLTESEEGAATPTQVCSLITWIHKRQFKKDQEVTNREFKYAMTVNYFLSDPNLPNVISRLKTEVASKRADGEIQTVYVHLHGERYLAEDFLQSLEHGQFVDFTIDFERALLLAAGARRKT